MSNPSITADKTPWYQWDTGLTVTVSGGEMNECHFANRKQGTAYVQAVINGVARVPDELLQVAAPIKVYGYVSDGAGGQTYIEETFDVIARNIPADYTYTKTAQKTIRDAEAARDDAVQAANDAKASELAADDNAVEASNSAQSAGESASAASTSASNAAKSAGDAAKSASDAKAAAGKAVEDASALLKTYTDNAKTSADNAATSASNAADAASAASGSASAAEQSATDASNAKVAAQTAKAEAEAAKAEAATSASNAADSATAAAKSASDAASVGDKTLSEAKKYTDANTSNALVGTVSGKLLHVEDAWPGKPLGLTIDGAYKQDGTPSPENPVPITVVENPVLKVTGRNLLDVHAGMPESDCNKDFDKDKKRIIKPGTYVAGLTSTNYVQKINISDALFSEGGTTFISNAGGYGVGFGVSLVPGETYELTLTSTNAGCAVMFYASDGTYLSYVGTQIFTVPANAAYTVILIVPSSVNQPVSASNIFIKRKDTDGTYAPYICTSLPITLPAEHPYLAKLPDGTCDEIVVSDGRARINCVLRKEVISDVNYIGNTGTFQYVQVGVATGKPIDGDTHFMCNRFIAGGRYAGGVYVAGGVNAMFFFCFPLGTFQDSSEAESWFAANPTTVVYKDANGIKTINLGKLDIPALPETISNVWTDAELTTNMSMTYKRDINIAFDSLVQAVVAAAAGE